MTDFCLLWALRRAGRGRAGLAALGDLGARKSDFRRLACARVSV